MGCICSRTEEYFERRVLRDADENKIPWLNAEGRRLQCRVVNVYDADTVTIIFRFDKMMYKKKVRLTGIDAAGIRTKDPREKAHALAGKAYVEKILLNRVLWIECGDWDKYGRLLGTFYLSRKHDISVNMGIVVEGWAYEYDGKKKRAFADWCPEPVFFKK